MAQHKLRSRIAQFKQPFLVGAVTTAALISGCGGEVQGTDGIPDDQTGASDECPTGAPKSGEACDEYEAGLDCAYADESSCQREFSCQDGTWEDVSPSCNPPAPDPSSDCPEVTPAAGTGCVLYEAGLDCSYVDESGCAREFACSDGEWEDVSPTCNPPPPELECPEVAPAAGEDCETYEPGLNCEYGDESSCAREFACSEGEWEDVSPTCNPPAVVESDAGVDGGVDPGVEVDAGVGVDAGEPDGG